MSQLIQKQKVEILAPAGSYEAFKAALCAGADAFYAGGEKFGARAFAVNFSQEELIQAIQEAHIFDKKFYLTVNTLLKNQEIDSLYDYIAPLYKSGLDAVIVQDAGVLEYIRSYFPDLDIHGSTQMTITGPHGARFLKSQGCTRVVPARELSIEDVRMIRKSSDIEIECFVHGALCYCYSGQCLFSSMIGGRSGNRGQCAQPCRLPYTHKNRKQYYLSPKDICTLDLIPELVDAGINSFKIEGRMKKPEYVAGVTSVYKKYTDLYLEKGREGFFVKEKDREALMDLYNRGGFSNGYFMQHNGLNMIAINRPNHAGVPAAEISGIKGRRIDCIAVTDINKGDVLEIKGGKTNYTSGTDVKKGCSFSFLVQKGTSLYRGEVLNRVKNESLLKKLDDLYVHGKAKRKITGKLSLLLNKSASLTVECENPDGRIFSYTAVSDEPVQSALKQPADSERILTQIQKTGNSEFDFEYIDLEMDENIFVPVQALNTLRRNAVSGLKNLLISSKSRELHGMESLCNPDIHRCNKNMETASVPTQKISVLAANAEQLEMLNDYIKTCRRDFIKRIYIDYNIAADSLHEKTMKKISSITRDTERELYLALPAILRYHDNSTLLKQIEKSCNDNRFDGVLVRNYEEYMLLKDMEFDKNVILDHNLYVFNRYAKTFWEKIGVNQFTAPFELNSSELFDLGMEHSEIIIYGRIPLMFSAQCINKSAGNCTKQPSVTEITDRYGCSYPVISNCKQCYNIILDSSPLYLGNFSDQLRALSPKMMRVQFSTENKDECSKILNLVSENFLSDSNRCKPAFEYTQGHFKRGIS